MRLSETKEALKNTEPEKKIEEKKEPFDMKKDVLGASIRMKDETKYLDRDDGVWKTSPAGITITLGRSYIKVNALQLRGLRAFINDPVFSAELDKRADDELKSLSG